MEELVITIITIIAVIKLIYRQNGKEKKKSKQTGKLDLIKKLVTQMRIEINVTNTKRKC